MTDDKFPMADDFYHIEHEKFANLTFQLKNIKISSTQKFIIFYNL